MDAVADTSLLVGLWRRQGWAVQYAANNAGLTLGIPWIVLGEFWHGAQRAGHPEELVRNFLTLGQTIWDPEPVVPEYARLCASLQDHAVYYQIGQNDLWIAAVAVTINKPLVTRNLRHFGAVPGLRYLVAG